MKYTSISSKMKKGKPLLNDRVLSHHVPATRWYHDASRVLKKLTGVSYKIAHKLGSCFPFRIVGLDMGIAAQNGITVLDDKELGEKQEYIPSCLPSLFN
jgi:hypothetical protein